MTEIKLANNRYTLDNSVKAPGFFLFGEQSALPGALHVERLSVRAPLTEWAIQPHRHPDLFQIIVIFSGSALVNLGADLTRLTADQGVWLPPNIVHGFQFEPSTDGLVISLARSFCPEDIDPQAKLSAWSGAFDSNCLDWFRNLENQYQQSHRFQERLLAHLAAMTFWQLAPSLQLHFTSAAQRDFERFDDFLRSNMAQSIRLSEISTQLGYSLSRLHRLCKEVTGLAPAQYVERLRLDEACRLLAFTQLRINAVASVVGYPDPAHFARVFRRVAGQTPKQYRQQFSTHHSERARIQ